MHAVPNIRVAQTSPRNGCIIFNDHTKNTFIYYLERLVRPGYSARIFVDDIWQDMSYII